MLMLFAEFPPDVARLPFAPVGRHLHTSFNLPCSRLAPDHYRSQRQPPRNIGILGLVGKPQRMAMGQLVRHPQGQLVLASGDPVDVERLLPDPGKVAGQQAAAGNANSSIEAMLEPA